MATINDIVNIDSRKGDIAAGGGDSGALNIETKPLETLSLYTNFYNKSVYDQTVKDRDTKLSEIAKVSAIDANNLFGKDKDTIVAKLNNLRDFATQYAKNPNLTIDDQLKWQTALSDVNNDYLSGKERAVTYQSQLNDINTKYSGDEAAARLKELNTKFNDTDISTPISSGTGYKPVAVNIPSPIQSTYQMNYNDGNIVTTANVGILVPDNNIGVATATSMGLNSLGKELKGTEAELQATASGKAQQWAAMTQPLNKVLATKKDNGDYKYFTSDGNGGYTFSYNLFKNDFSNNDVIMPAIDAVINASKYATQKKAEVSQGFFTDRNIKYQAPPQLRADQFDSGIINITPDGLTPTNLIYSGMVQDYQGDKTTKDFKKTGLGIEQQQANATSMNAETNRMKANQDREEFKYKKDHPTGGSATKSASALDTPSIMFGNHVQRLKDYFDKNPDQTVTVRINAVDKDTRKAMGISDKAVGDVESVTYKSDGSYSVKFNNNKAQDANGKEVDAPPRVGTIEQLKQGYIDAVKGGNSNQQGFQEKSEQGFSNNFGGLTDGKSIWDKWGGAKSDNSQQEQTAKPLADPTLDNNTANWKTLSNGNYQYIDGSIYNAKGKKIK